MSGNGTHAAFLFEEKFHASAASSASHVAPAAHRMDPRSKVAWPSSVKVPLLQAMSAQGIQEFVARRLLGGSEAGWFLVSSRGSEEEHKH
eukprot:CAMPEP_0206052442 /NCGR_PEP_ID=MMETSP1466-20131121/33770_1 /ASSEMBLY_ACC=CAM_ASM_001126 /TAXON_ID=44452 /ORGANISM="Pavlova gyrans, Strain CCMP608" /LENGTH=89 /DNA_ID=CAMNT_0053427597 /DNA_START=1383 /DNA_END=1648 /DNA_ORIENTATION=-